jgi:serine/threonine protein phosphatase 1
MLPRRFVIGDVHGCFKTFDFMLFNELKITKDDEIYLLGDYIDRGPCSKEVIDLIISLQEQHYNIFPIRGNHEEMLISSLKSFNHFEQWIHNGAKHTLKSFGISHTTEFELKYLEFFFELPYYYELKDFIIVHGGLNFSIEDPFTDLTSMVWLRNPYVDLKKTKGKRIIVGHTPVHLEIIKASLGIGQIYLDGGCVYAKKYEGLGWLAALELNSFKIHSVYNMDYLN